MNLRPLFAIVVKDLKLHIGNRRAMIITLVLPIFLASFMGSIFGGQTGKTKTSGVRVQVVDLDKSIITAEIITNLCKDETLEVQLVTEPDARQALRNGKIAVAVIFPKNFGDDASVGLFGGGTKPELTILRDPSRNMEAAMVQGILMQHIMESIGKNVFSAATGRKYVKNGIDWLDTGVLGLADEDNRVLRSLLTNADRWLERTATNSSLGGLGSGGFSMPFAVKNEETARKENEFSRYNGYAHSFGGFGLQFVLMAAMDWGISIILDRQRGLWRRLRAAPLSRTTLLGARAISSSIIGFSTLLMCWAFSIAVFHVHVSGSWAGFIAINAAVAVFAASLGLCIASIGKTPEATRGISIFAILILVMLGGAWVPTFIFPAWLQKVTTIVPTRWAVDCFDAMTWRGLGIGSAVAPVAVLLGYASVLTVLAVKFFKWETD